MSTNFSPGSVILQTIPGIQLSIWQVVGIMGRGIDSNSIEGAISDVTDGKKKRKKIHRNRVILK